jgi:hypothetical protein
MIERILSLTCVLMMIQIFPFDRSSPTVRCPDSQKQKEKKRGIAKRVFDIGVFWTYSMTSVRKDHGRWKVSRQTVDVQ